MLMTLISLAVGLLNFSIAINENFRPSLRILNGLFAVANLGFVVADITKLIQR